MLQSFEMVASLFAQQDNFTVDFVDISFVAEVVSVCIVCVCCHVLIMVLIIIIYFVTQSSTENFQAGGSSEDFGGQGN